MHSFKLYAAAASALIGLTGCCTSASTDPREGGLAGGVCGTSTGAYNDRVAQREYELDRLASLSRSMEARIVATNKETADLLDQINAMQAPLDRIEQQLQQVQELRAQQNTQRDQNAAVIADLVYIESELERHQVRNAALHQQISALESEQETASYQAAIDDLRQSISDLETRANIAIEMPGS